MRHPSSHTLSAHDLTVERGGQTVLRDIDLVLTAASRVAVVGANGVGKTTLLRVLVGDVEPGGGSVVRRPDLTTVGLLPQELDPTTGARTRDFIAEAVGVAAASRRFTAATDDLAADAAGSADTYADALEAWLRLGGADFDARLDAVADRVGLAPTTLDLAPSALSGGQAARARLAAMMLGRFDIALLDEPTNDLDLAGLALLEGWVEGFAGGLAVVSHDRAFLERVATSVLEIDEHDHRGHHYQGGWAAFTDERATRRAQAEERYAVNQAERSRLSNRAQQQREWVARGATRAARRPADPDKHRRRHDLAQTEKLAGKARSTERALERLEEVEKPWEGWDLRFTINEAPRGSTLVAAFEGVVVERGSWRLGPVDLQIEWADRVALTGANGTGKSTLIDLLLGRHAPAEGRVRVGPSVRVGELEQARDGLARGEVELLDAFVASAGVAPSQARAVLAKFALGPDAVSRPAATLSPGERTRARLAWFQATGVNLIVLDEPTNHLDLPAIEQLEAALESYTGTLLLVSHDRRMLENVRLTRRIAMADLTPG